MAIHCVDPNRVGTLTEEMYNVTNGLGRTLLNDFTTNFESLKSHWKGTDATKNLTDLANVYREVAELVTALQRLVVEVNNNEILPLQKHINALGGNCLVGNELSVALNVDTALVVPTSDGEVWSDVAIVTDATEFAKIPAEFDRFVASLNDAKDNLLNNWLDGSSRDEVVRLFNEFNNNVGTYKDQLNVVKENLNTVAEVKGHLL